VTLIVGIICKDGIALAADSQTTYYPSKFLGTNKINEIKFQNGKALIAEAGFCSLSNAVVDFIKKKAETTEIKDEETIAEICKQAVCKERQNQISLYPRRKFSLMEWQSFFRDQQNFFLTIAYYFNEKPYLFSVDLSQCVLQKPTFGFIVSGVGEAVGNYILKEESDYYGGFEKMDLELGTAIAIKVADAAAEYVDGCGRPLKAAYIKPSVPIPDLLPAGQSSISLAGLGGYFPRQSYSYSDPITILPQSTVDEIAKIILSVQRKVKSTQNKKIHQALRSRTQKEIEKFLKDTGFELSSFGKTKPPKLRAGFAAIGTKMIRKTTNKNE
jgi:20S proteasome alpha/beta subunit